MSRTHISMLGLSCILEFAGQSYRSSYMVFLLQALETETLHGWDRWKSGDQSELQVGARFSLTFLEKNTDAEGTSQGNRSIGSHSYDKGKWENDEKINKLDAGGSLCSGWFHMDGGWPHSPNFMHVAGLHSSTLIYAAGQWKLQP